VGRVQEVLKVDTKGRIQVPKKIRQRLGIKETVRASLRGQKLIIETEDDPLHELAEIIQTRFKDLEKELPSLRRAAEEQALKEIKEQ
jgi:AbrB family looped-hinge helix DNA binding protein